MKKIIILVTSLAIALSSAAQGINSNCQITSFPYDMWSYNTLQCWEDVPGYDSWNTSNFSYNIGPSYNISGLDGNLHQGAISTPKINTAGTYIVKWTTHIPVTLTGISMNSYAKFNVVKKTTSQQDQELKEKYLTSSMQGDIEDSVILNIAQGEESRIVFIAEGKNFTGGISVQITDFTIRQEGGSSSACEISTFPYTMTFEDDNELSCWSIYDGDNDGLNWILASSTTNPFGHNSNSAIASASYDDDTESPLTPDNWLLSPAFVLTAGSQYHLTWYAQGLDQNYAAEHYSVYVSTTGSNPSDFTNSVYSGTTTAAWMQHDVDLSSYAGQTIYVAFRHHNSSDQYYLLIDDIRISEPVQYTITVTSNDETMGTVSGGGSFSAGANTTITATAKNNYRFSRWQDNNTDNPRTITVNGNASYTAYFEAIAGIDDIEGHNGIILYSQGTSIVINGADGMQVLVTDIIGHTIQSITATSQTRVQVPSNGVYFVRVKDHPACKVVVVQ